MGQLTVNFRASVDPFCLTMFYIELRLVYQVFYFQIKLICLFIIFACQIVYLNEIIQRTNIAMWDKLKGIQFHNRLWIYTETKQVTHFSYSPSPPPIFLLSFSPSAALFAKNKTCQFLEVNLLDSFYLLKKQFFLVSWTK